MNGTPTQYTYTYDAVGRLKSATKDGTATTSWTYDGNGNRLMENGVTSTFDAQDRLLTKGTTTYTWGALGGRKTKTEGGQTTQYTHDGMGALLSVTLPDSTAITYEYDARQRRVAKRRNGAVEARWVYDGQYQIAAQLDVSGNVTHRFVYGSQSHSPDYVVKGGVTYAYVKNHLGSIRFVVNATDGTVAQQLDYDAWGNVLSDSTPGFQPFAFAGGIYDRDTKLTHFGYRDYDASSGIWTAKDPIRLSGGANEYWYGNGDPASRADSSGLDSYIVNCGGNIGHSDVFVENACYGPESAEDHSVSGGGFFCAGWPSLRHNQCAFAAPGELRSPGETFTTPASFPATCTVIHIPQSCEETAAAWDRMQSVASDPPMYGALFNNCHDVAQDIALGNGKRCLVKENGPFRKGALIPTGCPR